MLNIIFVHNTIANLFRIVEAVIATVNQKGSVPFDHGPDWPQSIGTWSNGSHLSQINIS